MNRRLRLAAIAAPALLVVLVAVLFLVDFSSHRGLIPRAVVVADVKLGGTTAEEALRLLSVLEERLASAPIEAHVNGGSAPVLPRDLGISLDKEAMVAEALALGDQGILQAFTRWVRTLGTPETLPLHGLVDEEVLSDALDELAERIVGEAPFPGSITIVDGQLVADHPRPGLAIDLESASPQLLAAFLVSPHPSVVLELVPAAPRLTAAHIDAALREAQRLLGGDITLLPPGDAEPLVFTVADLQAAFRADVVRDGEGHRMAVSFDQAILFSQLAPIAQELASDPVNAELIFDDETHLVSIAPSLPGTSVDFDGILGAITTAAATPGRTGSLPVIEDVEAEVTTEMLEEFQIRHMVSSFTTYHQCCQDRVVNIQLMADTVSGTFVGPGEIFSLNGVVGERTIAGGYRPAGTIVAGELEDTIGGGVSQFSTTLYNAMFWGGYEDVIHTPHSFYFSRYPEGIEATINWPDLHNKFRNNTDTPIVVRTQYTDNSITVEIWGNNDGRIVWGDQWEARTTIDVLAEGGANARRVTAEVSGRYAETEPKPKYEPDPLLRPGSQVIDDDGGIGWSVRATRFIEQLGQTTSQEWTVRYSARPILTRVHPCMLNGAALEPDWETGCPADNAPTVTASGPPSTTIGVAISLSATAADDWDATTLTYAWSGPGAVLSKPGSAATSVTFAAAGDYIVSVTVTDGAGNMSVDTLAISVTE